MVKINGELLQIEGITIAQYLNENQYNRNRIAIELNGDMLPKSRYDSTVLSDGDVVEIVCFVGGG